MNQTMKLNTKSIHIDTVENKNENKTLKDYNPDLLTKKKKEPKIPTSNL